MEATQTTNPLLRSDTLFGVCQALGDDLGINPLWLRIPLASAILFSPTGAVAAYFGLGLLVLVSRLVFPPKKVAVTTVAEASVEQRSVATEEASAQDTRELAEAA